MQVKWENLAMKGMVWLTAEILLGWAGLDNLADYGEFVAGDHSITQQCRQGQIALCWPLLTRTDL